MSCLILGDLHIGKGINIGKPAQLGKLNSRIQDQIDLLEWALQYTVNYNLQNIILTGDVYQEPRPHPTVIAIFLKWLKKCEHNNINVHIVMGNHDIIRNGGLTTSALDLVEAAELKAIVYRDVTNVEFDNFSLLMVPFFDKRMLESKDMPPIDILKNKIQSKISKSNNIKFVVGHLAIEGSLEIGDEITDSLNELYVPIDIFNEFDYIWMGHIHKPQVLNFKNPYIAHIGSLDRSDFSKSEIEFDKIAIVIDSNCEFKQIKIPTRTLSHIKIEVPKDKDSTEFVINNLCLENKKKSLNNSIIRLEIILGGIDQENIDREKIEDYLYNHIGIHHICNISESRALFEIEINPEDSFDSAMEIGHSINKWAETREFFESDDEREKFKKIAHECLIDFESKNQKENHEAA